MADQQTEVIEFDDMKVPIHRQPTHETYIALQPPSAQPYLVAPKEAKPEDIIAFVKTWIEVIRELRAEMIKRFEKSKSMKCHYQTGDVAYLFGRPFMLRVYPLKTGKQRTKGARGRANVQANTQSEVSVINLFLLKTGDYDQGRMAFQAFAKPILVRNAQNMVGQCMARTFPEAPVPKKVNCRPMRDAWVRIDNKTDTVWFSESLIPYPPDCVVYAFLVEMIKKLEPDATEEERHALLEKGVPGWQRMKAILADPNSVYAQQ